MAAVTDQVPEPLKGAFVRASESVSFIKSKLPPQLQNPRIAIVCGSGLGGIADTVSNQDKVEIDYLDIPNFPKTTGEFETSTKIIGHASLDF